MKKLAVFLCAVVLLVEISTGAQAAMAYSDIPDPSWQAWMGVDGAYIPVSVFPYYVDNGGGGALKNGDAAPYGYLFDVQSLQFPNGDVLSFNGSSKMDPTIASGIAVIDNGAPSTFSFFFASPIILPPGANMVSASIVGGMTNAQAGSAIGITPTVKWVVPDQAAPDVLASGLGIVPGPWTNMGVDVGLSISNPNAGQGAFFGYGAFAAGPLPGPVAPWGWMAHEYGFMGTGGGDVYALTGFSQIVAMQVPVPEPMTLILLGLGLAGIGLVSRKK